MYSTCPLATTRTGSHGRGGDSAANRGKNVTSAYIRHLRQWVSERHAAAAAVRAHNARPLYQKIQDWWTALPPQERRPCYTMDQLVLVFNAAPGAIGTALHRIGWVRHRNWSGGQSYARYWVPAPRE